MSQAGLVDIEGSHPQIPTSFVTDDGIAIPIANVLEILGTTVANYGVPLRTTGSGNTVTVVAQYATANATSSATLAGLSSYDSAFFSVDPNGFVSFIGSTSVTINGDTGSITGNNLTIFANNATNNAGASVKFVNAVTTSVLNVTDVNLNTFIGKLSGTLTVSGSENTGLGSTALAAISSGVFNTAVGSRALASMQTGISNTAVGLAALNSNVSGQENVAVGEECLTLNTSNFNTCVGCKSMNAAGAGNSNSYLGYAAGNALTSGNSNTGVGFQTQGVNSTGNFNASLGYQTLQILTSGSYNIALGPSAGNALASSESSNILIGSPGVVTESNTIRIGQQGVGAGQQNRAFMAGIVGTTVTGNFVNVSASGQLGSVSSGSIGQTLTGNSGGARPPSSGNWNIVTANASPTFIGSGSTLTLDFGLTNLLLGSVGTGITTASSNTGIGPTNLSALTTGIGNVAVGLHALDFVTSGQSNVGIGLDALGAVTVQNNNTAVGRSCLSMTTSNGATAVGYAALRFNVTGDNNTAIGFQAFGNSTGSQNTGVGYNVGVNVIGGEQNVVMGALAFVTAVSSNYCTAVGYQALNACTGSQNTAIGRASLVKLQNADDNTGVGFNTLFGVTTGAQNTALGSSALTQILTGSNNIAIGYTAGNAYTLADSGNIVIGNVGVVGTSNAIRIGTTGTHTSAFMAGISGVTVAASVPVVIDVNGQMGTIVSSERFKTNIEDMGDRSAALMKLRPVVFNYKDSLDTKAYGFIAEEVEKIFPDMVVYGDDKKPMSVKYHEMPAILVQELQKALCRIEKLEKMLEK